MQSSHGSGRLAGSSGGGCLAHGLSANPRGYVLKGVAENARFDAGLTVQVT